MAWSEESEFLLRDRDNRVRVCSLTGEQMAPGYTMGRRQGGKVSVMLQAMFCWETSAPGLHVDVTLAHITYLNTAED